MAKLFKANDRKREWKKPNLEETKRQRYQELVQKNQEKKPVVEAPMPNWLSQKLAALDEVLNTIQSCIFKDYLILKVLREPTDEEDEKLIQYYESTYHFKVPEKLTGFIL